MLCALLLWLLIDTTETLREKEKKKRKKNRAGANLERHIAVPLDANRDSRESSDKLIKTGANNKKNVKIKIKRQTRRKIR